MEATLLPLCDNSLVMTDFRHMVALAARLDPLSLEPMCQVYVANMLQPGVHTSV